jgi:metal-responsive CopG/Arc/MetJ family transcriptional regulator
MYNKLLVISSSIEYQKLLYRPGYISVILDVHLYTKRSGIMASKTERVSARVPEDLVRRLEDVMDREGISSYSEVLRECIEEYIKLKTPTFSAEKILVDIGEDILSDIDNLVDIGRVAKREEAFAHAIKTWTEAEVEKYLVKRDRYSKAVSDAKTKILAQRGQKNLNSFYERP